MPVTRFQVRVAAGPGRHHGAPGRRATPSRSSSASSTPTAPTSTRRAQRKIERSSTARTSAGRSPPTSATSASRPGPSSTTRAALMRHRRRRRHPRPPASRSWSTTPTARPRFVMPNVLAKLGADVLAVNPYASTAGRRRLRAPTSTPPRVADLVRAVGRPPRARCIDPDGEHLTLDRRRGPRPHRRRRPCWRCVHARRRRPASRAPRSPCRCRSAAAAERIAAEAGRRDRVDQAVDARPHGRRRVRAASPSPPARTAASSSPTSCPPSTPPPPSSSCSSCWPAPGSRLSKVVAGLPRGPRGPRERGHARGSRRAWSCARWSSRPRTASVVLVDGVKVIHDDGWALVLPDPEEPVTHVWAEGAERRRGPPPGPGVRPPHPPAAAVAQPRRRAGHGATSRAMNVPDDLRYTQDHEWARLEDGRVRIGHHRLRPGRPGRRGVRAAARASAPTVEAGASARRGRVDQVGVRHLRPGGRHGRRGQRRAGRRAPAPQRGPLRRGLDLRDRARRPGRRSTRLLDADGYRALIDG